MYLQILSKILENHPAELEYKDYNLDIDPVEVEQKSYKEGYKKFKELLKYEKEVEYNSPLMNSNRWKEKLNVKESYKYSNQNNGRDNSKQQNQTKVVDLNNIQPNPDLPATDDPLRNLMYDAMYRSYVYNRQNTNLTVEQLASIYGLLAYKFEELYQKQFGGKKSSLASNINIIDQSLEDKMSLFVIRYDNNDGVFLVKNGSVIGFELSPALEGTSWRENISSSMWKEIFNKNKEIIK